MGIGMGYKRLFKGVEGNDPAGSIVESVWRLA
jgi:hypothetical protein